VLNDDYRAQLNSQPGRMTLLLLGAKVAKDNPRTVKQIL
jgi:hypothetical protein